MQAKEGYTKGTCQANKNQQEYDLQLYQPSH